RPRQDLIKSAGHCSKSALDKRAKDVAAMIKETFIQNSVFKYHKKDSILLKSFEYTVNGQNYYLSFGTDNAQKEYDILNIVKIMDSNYISHDAYRSLAAIDYHLPRQKVKHVMTFMILNDQEHHHIPSYHHTIALYPGIEKYKSLEVILNPFLNNLRDLKVNGLEVEDKFIELYMVMCNQDSDPLYLKHLAFEWLKLFLKPDERDPKNPQKASIYQIM
ncbi:1874_t:CDS:2, partial [Racocetra fulgida]